MEFAELRMIIQDHVERIQFVVTDLGEQDVFIGYEWLKKHNPDVDWQKETLYFSRCPDDCGYITTLDELDGDPEEQVRVILEEGDHLYMFDIEGYMNNCATHGWVGDTGVLLEHVLLAHCQDYKDVFKKGDFNQLPERRVWDHAIELTENFKPVDCKVYPLNPSEQEWLKEFIEENLCTGRI